MRGLLSPLAALGIPLQHNALGQRMRATVAGTTWRYIYFGDRVLEETNDDWGPLARHTVGGPSYYEPWLHMQRAGGVSRFPALDGVGTARRLVDAGGAATDTYALDAFGRLLGAEGSTQNPYRFGAAWGYITDTPGSGLLQLGARHYWAELGRFLQQDPVGEGVNCYVYADNNPLVWVDPEGLLSWGEFREWYMGGMGGLSDLVDDVLLNGATRGFGEMAGLYDVGCVTRGQFAWAGAKWGARLGWAGATAYAPLRAAVGGVWRATARGGLVTRWGPPGRWVMVGGASRLSYWLSGAPERGYPFGSACSWVVGRGGLRYPPGVEWFKGLFGQRVLR